MHIIWRSLTCILLLSTVILISGCDSGEACAFAKVGSDPEDVALRLVKSIYETNSLDYALAKSSPRLAKLINRYKTNRNVQKNLFYQMYDKVEVKTESQGRAGRKEFAKQASIVVLLKGEYNGDTIVQLRNIKMSRAGKEWQVSAVEVSGF
mgnify:CR=1 FL=1